jgi:aldehyde:ferredoxin oxidoreductase
MDVPPARWFKEPLNVGFLKGAKLDRSKYDALLQSYYDKRGWSANGFPKKETLEKLGLPDVVQQLNP